MTNQAGEINFTTTTSEPPNFACYLSQELNKSSCRSLRIDGISVLRILANMPNAAVTQSAVAVSLEDLRNSEQYRPIKSQ
jgi:hypothetical protein